MKLFLLCFVGLVTLSAAHPNAPQPPYPRGCIYAVGRCVEECPIGTRAYATGCGQKTPEATCDEPNPVKEEGIICDFSACYCDAPTVRDSKSKKCVKLEECPKKEHHEKEHPRHQHHRKE